MGSEADPLALRRLPLTDGVVRLRLPAETDVGTIVEICADPDVVRFTPSVPTPYGELDALAWLAVQAADVQGGRALHLAVDELESGLHVATVMLFGLDRIAGAAEVGYLVRPAARGRGIALRALRLLVEHAHDALGLDRLRLMTLPDNAPSRLVALRCGFREEGVVRGVRWRGERRDAVLHGHLAGEPLWPLDPLATRLLPLGDGVVSLRLPRLADVDLLVQACSDPEIARWTTVPSPDDASHAADFVLLAARGVATGTDVPFVIADPETDRLLGAVGLHGIREGEATVGYWVAPWARGRGVAGRGLGLALGHAFDVLGLHRVEAEVLVGNDASVRILERAGFVREGLQRARTHRDGAVGDRILLGLVRMPS